MHRIFVYLFAGSRSEPVSTRSSGGRINLTMKTLARGAALIALLCWAVPSHAAVTARSGAWTNPATWGGTLPRSQEKAEIRAGHEVTFDAASAEVAELTVRGTLRIARDRATKLVVGCNLVVYGTLDMGRPGDHIPSHITHDLVFRLTRTRAAGFVGGAHFEPTDCGLWVMGRWDAHAAPLTRAWGKLAGDVVAGATELTVDGDVSDWPAGGQVAITQTSDGLTYSVTGGQTPRNTSRLQHETEYATIAAVNGSTVVLTSPVRFAHSGSGQMRGEVGLLSRNVTISTELEGVSDVANDVRLRKFAHISFMPTAHGDGGAISDGGGKGDLYYVAFRHMGHYGKDGRYALHYHRLGDGARGMIVRGVSWFESGFRCTNLHESNGMLVEDTVCVNPMGAAHFVQTDDRSQQQDSVFVHNLVVSHVGLHFADRNTPGIKGERLRSAAGFWPGASEHEAYLGNVSAGSAPDGADATGYHWPEEPVSDMGTIARTFVANEAHSLTFAGWHSWQNRGSKGHDIVGGASWGNATGFLHGAYGFSLYVYNALFASNRVGYRQDVTHGFLQDSTVIGRGENGVRLEAGADLGIAFDNYNIQPHPWAGSHFLRNTFARLTPGRGGEPGVAIWRGSGTCTTRSDEIDWAVRHCSSSFPRIAQNTFEPGVHPYHFGWSDGPRPFFPNVNSFWLDYDRQLVLLRKDQRKPEGQFTPLLVTPATFHDPVADALATPFSSLPPSITFTNLKSARGRAYGDFTLRLAYDPPPTVTLTARLTGTQLAMTAEASADTQRVEFWVDWVLVGTDTAAPFEAVADLAALAQYGDPLPARRWAYAYARAFDGVIINSGNAEGNDFDPGYAQRAYSKVVEITPEMRRQGAAAFNVEEVPPPQSNASDIQQSAADGTQMVGTTNQPQLALTPVVRDLELPTAVAVAADGTIFVAERGGAVRVIRDGVPAEGVALDLSRDVALPGGGLLAIALDPRFDANRFMYALYAAALPRGGHDFVLARFRFANGTFAERAVLLDRVPASASDASGALSIGPDGKLYVALDSAGDTHLAGNSASYNGKVLRLNLDGTTPDDQPQLSPVFSSAHPEPHALDWQPGTGHLWVIDGIHAGGGRLSVITGPGTQPGDPGRTSYALPAGTHARSAAFYRGDLVSSFTGNLLVAANGGRELICLQLDPENPSRVAGVQRLLTNEIGGLRVVTEGRDGAVYVATEHTLYRLTPPRDR